MFLIALGALGAHTTDVAPFAVAGEILRSRERVGHAPTGREPLYLPKKDFASAGIVEIHVVTSFLDCTARKI